MVRLDRIMVPVPLMLVIVLYAVFLTPAYPVDVHRLEVTGPCPPTDSCRTYSNYTELEPAILPILAGFSWSSRLLVTDGGSFYEYSSSAAIVAVHVMLASLISIALILRWRDKVIRTRLNFRRRYWRALLWGMGFFFLILSVYWAWSFMIFYGVMQNAAALDPFLISLLGTFLLSGLGLVMMMLSVRSRAIWPAPSNDEQ